MSEDTFPVAAREVLVHLHLAEGHTCRTILRSDSDLLRDLLSALAAGARGSRPPKLFQVPVRDTRGLYTFSNQELVGITTEPPVRLSERAGRTITTLETSTSHEPQRIGAAASTFVQFDDFLTPDEHRQLLDYALFHEPTFFLDEKSGHSAAWVSGAFTDSPLADRIGNRLQLLLPQILQSFELWWRAEGPRLTAHSDGDELTPDAASRAEVAPGELTCCYYFHRTPRPFTGGELRVREANANHRHWVEPRDNGLLVYPTQSLHQVVPLRCASRAFADRRFAVTAHGVARELLLARF